MAPEGGQLLTWLTLWSRQGGLAQPSGNGGPPVGEILEPPLFVNYPLKPAKSTGQASSKMVAVASNYFNCSGHRECVWE